MAGGAAVPVSADQTQPPPLTPLLDDALTDDEQESLHPRPCQPV